MMIWATLASFGKKLTFFGCFWLFFGGVLLVHDLLVLGNLRGYRKADFVVGKTVFARWQGETEFHAEGSIDGVAELFSLHELAGIPLGSCEQHLGRYSSTRGRVAETVKVTVQM